MKLRTIDIPQADSLSLVREVVHAVKRAPNVPVKAIADATGFQERHVRYRIATARALGFITPEQDGTRLTPRGERLLAAETGSPEEREAFCRAINACPAVKELIPDLLTRQSIDLKELTARIIACTGLSRSTAERRAVVLRAWHRDYAKER
jgi:hypothetical protein